MFWNENGILSRRAELQDFINKHSPDIILLQETPLRPSKNSYFANFHCYRTDRENQNIHKPNGGTAILIKNHLPHHHIPTPQLFYIESTIINLTLPKKDPIIIISTYIPPSSDPNFFTLDIENLMQLGPYCIFGGDFNAHNKAWGLNNN
ncbi:hypothetical protein AVEN_9138-1 [Araneus ventricosus]|uniref:Endonuclease/exonuclease/phosphatase domain-containing protein n=1 Tax=Araneus ventricosus TaxID=182803 RepID=A0A4Y2XA04_ARAVE|nr:hypothetical protein AVEN_9138-1 [Araneus ventricosus]